MSGFHYRETVRNFVPVKNRPFFIFLLVVIALNSFSLQHLFKLPILFVHYQEHQQRGTDITVMEFLSMHYWGTDINDDDQARDMELPFKKVEISQSALSVFFQPNHVFDLTTYPVITRYQVIHYDRDFSAPLGSPFRPPRLS